MKLFKLFKKIFKRKQLVAENPIKSITVGERDEEGFCYAYVNGEKTNLRLLVFSEEEIEKLHKIEKEIHEKIEKNEDKRIDE